MSQHFGDAAATVQRMTAAPADSEENRLTQAFRRDEGPSPSIRALRTASLSVTEIWSEQTNLVFTGTVPRDDAYVITLHLRDRPKGAMRAEGSYIQPKNFRAGNAGIVDLRMRLVSEYAGPFHYLSCYLPHTTLEKVIAEAGIARPCELRHRPGVGYTDTVVRHLLCSLQPALAAERGEVNGLYTDHVALALITHVATNYGDVALPQIRDRGGLAPWQERRAKELIDTRLTGAVTLAELARECQLSVRQFTRAFRQSTGQSTHRWLIERRLDKARALLRGSNCSLSEIARVCGFANQGHFTRTFTRAVGLSPGQWQRRQRVS